MDCSVIVRTRDEADRLRLTLTSLGAQSAPAQIIVVNDGSVDHTPKVIEEFADLPHLLALHHREAKGRSAAANAGARAAAGRFLLFLDGDTLAHPHCVARHERAHLAKSGLLGRGETFHLRSTRFLLDPESASPRPDQQSHWARMTPAERELAKVTREQIRSEFASIDKRARPGVYPGGGPRALYELEIAALRDSPDCRVLWAAASGSNFSVPRDAFSAAGGFDEALDNNEHRELALRLCEAGSRMGFVEGARTYHLTHRIGWRDPLQDTRWESVFFQRHPIAAVKLLSVMWASLDAGGVIPHEGRILSLLDLEKAASGKTGVDFEGIRGKVMKIA